MIVIIQRKNGVQKNMKLLKTEEVGKILSFSPKKIRKMIAAGELPALKIGGEFRIRQEDLQNYVDGLSVV